MAWLDDRLYAHPKWLSVSLASRGVYAAGVSYASGWATGGILEKGALRAIECAPKNRRELIAVGLWDDLGSGVVCIHDWDLHNGKRDARKAAERKRKKDAYWAEKGMEPPAEDARRKPGETDGETTEDAVQPSVLKGMKEVKEVNEKTKGFNESQHAADESEPDSGFAKTPAGSNGKPPHQTSATAESIQVLAALEKAQRAHAAGKGAAA